MDEYGAEYMAKRYIVEYLSRELEFIDIGEFVEENSDELVASGDEYIEELTEAVADHAALLMEEIRDRVAGWNE